MSKSLPPEISLVHYNPIPILDINHPLVDAKISLQGAQLLSFKPINSTKDLLWLSEIEPFQLGTAIRGGIPICYPWFGGVKQPAHGIARIQLWELANVEVSSENIVLSFNFGELAKIEMRLGHSAELIFTQLSEEPAQLALHSYFNVSDITQVELYNLPTTCFNSLTQAQQAVSSPRKIAELVDEIYQAEFSPTYVVDKLEQRQIIVEHQNASEIVVWNPWHKATSGMNNMGYKTMVCVETARLSRLLNKGEQMAVKLSAKPL